MLSLVDECLDTIEARHGTRPDFNRLGYEDPAVYDRICAADTIGVFQIESRAQIATLPHTQPRTLDDLAVEVAIIRPGPILAGAARPYMEQRRRLAAGEPLAVRYDHPLLEPILRDTLGVLLFQEQVMEVAMAVAGFSAAQADSLRRSMSRRRSHEALEAHWPQFDAGAAAAGLSTELARTIFDKLLGFAAYGFPRGHALAFARLAYESAWLRDRYPAEYLAALINNQPMGFYSVGVLAGDARRHGLRLLRPAVNRSGARCTVESDQTLRLGLSSVRGLSSAAAEAIAAERDRGPYRSLFDFIRRTGVPRALVEHLIMVGAFGDLGLERRELLWQLGLLAGIWQGAPRRERAVAPLAQQPLPLPVDGDMVPLQPLPARGRLEADYALLGFSPSMHPLGLLRPQLGEAIHSSRHVERLPPGAGVQLAGMVVCRQRPGTAHGTLFLLLEDEFGLINVIVSAALYERQQAVLRRESFLLVRGALQRRGPTLNVIAHTVAPLRVPSGLPAPASHDFH